MQIAGALPVMTLISVRCCSVDTNLDILHGCVPEEFGRKLVTR